MIVDSPLTRLRTWRQLMGGQPLDQLRLIFSVELGWKFHSRKAQGKICESGGARASKSFRPCDVPVQLRPLEL